MAEATISSGTLSNTTDSSTQSGAAARPHLWYLDAVRTYAIILVVTFHVAEILSNAFLALTPAQTWLLIGLTSMAKGGVALFIMTSGMLLLGSKRPQTLGQFFGKRVRKVLIPFLFWAVVHFIWRIYANGEVLTLDQMVRELIQGPVYAHLWFIYMILGLYLITPLLKVMVQNASRELLTYFMGLWVVLSGVLPFVGDLFGIEVGIYRFLAVTYVGYFVAGYYFRDVTLNQRQTIIGMAVVAGMILFNQFATYFATQAAEWRYDNYFFEYSTLSMMILSVALFLVLKSLPWEAIFERYHFLKQPIVLIADMSFGIFLVHFMLLNSIRSGHFGFSFSVFTFHPIISVPLLSIITILGSMLIISVMRRIPLLRATVP